MNDKQILEMSDVGFNFGSHSMSPRDFSKLEYGMLESEIMESKSMIENLIKRQVSSFTYPFGKRASVENEHNFAKRNVGAIENFLGTRNRLNNTSKNAFAWERDNLEFPMETALSRFLLVSTLRSLKK